MEVSDRAKHLLDAYFAFEPDRYDLQVCLESHEAYTAEEVTILTSTADRELSFVPLLPRRSELQLNMKAKDETGANLILLSRAELNSIYEELFPPAINLLRKAKQRPAGLDRLLASKDWSRDLFSGAWAAEVRKSPKDMIELAAYFQERLKSLPEELDDEQATLLVLGEFLTLHLFGFYRPWIQARNPVQPEAEGVPGRVFVKYIVTGQILVNWLTRITSALLGWTLLRSIAIRMVVSSIHVRFRAPEGMILSWPVRVFPRPSDHALERGQAQFYVSQDQAARWFDKTRIPPLLSSEFRLNQTASTRALAAALFGVLALISLLPINDVGAAGSLFLPLALGLVAFGWDRPSVRAFAVTQLMLAVALMAIWLLHGSFPVLAKWAAVASLLISAYNLGEGLLVLGRSRATFEEEET